MTVNPLGGRNCTGSADVVPLRTMTLSCDVFESMLQHNMWWAYFATVVIVTINQIVKTVMVHLVPLEKQHTAELQDKALAYKVFWAQLLNTGAPRLAVSYQKLQPFDPI